MSFERVDKLLVNRKVVATRTQAQRLICSGAVKGKFQGQWFDLTKPAQKIPVDTIFDVADIEELKYVSRAGLKLQLALSNLKKNNLDNFIDALINPLGIILDVGQSTGGFTDCLLQAGVNHVVGIDVGHSQLAPSLRGNPKVTCIEGINARTIPDWIKQDYAPQGFDGVVMDVSFISQLLIIDSVVPLLKKGAVILALVKPQFEVGKDGVAKGGIVKNTELFLQVEEKIKAHYQQCDLSVVAYFPSDLPGSDGNQEYFIAAQCNS